MGEAAKTYEELVMYQRARDSSRKGAETRSPSIQPFGLNMRPMAVGLKGDQAVAQFQLGEKGKAILLMYHALVGAEQIDSKAGKTEKYCILIIGHVIVWMQNQLKVKYIPEINNQIAPGCCSNPNPPEIVMERTSPPFLLLWYQLAILEAMMGVTLGIIDELRKRTSAQKILSCELLLNYFLIAKYISTVDIEKFFSYLPEYVSIVAYMRDNTPSMGEGKCYDLIDSELSMIKPADWTSTLHLEYAKDAILALATTILCSSEMESRKQLLYQAVQDTIVADALREFIEYFEIETCPRGDICDITAFHLGRMMNHTYNINPEENFIATCRLWGWLLQTNFKAIVEDKLAEHLARRWEEIIKHQRILLCQPIITIPAIESAINDSTTGTVKIAKILLRLSCDGRSMKMIRVMSLVRIST